MSHGSISVTRLGETAPHRSPWILFRRAATVTLFLSGFALLPGPSFQGTVYSLVSSAPLPGPSLLSAQELDIGDAYFRSFEYERTDDFSNAVRALTPVLEAYPNGYTVNLRLGWLFYRNGNYSNAIEHYQAATTAAPFALEPKIGHLLPLMAQQRWAEAEVLAYQIVSMDHYNYYGNLRLATILRMQNELDAASQVAWKMAGAYPTDLLFLAERARIAAAQGDSEEAARLYTDLIILDPENQEARAFLGR